MNSKKIIRSESYNQKEIKGYLETKGFCLRYGSGGAFYKDQRGKERFVKYGKNGGSDLVGGIPINNYCQWIAVEVKTEPEWEKITRNYNIYWRGTYDKQDPRYRYKKQIEFIEDIKSKNGIGLFAWNWKQVDYAIQEFRSKLK